MDTASETLFALKPVTFRYKKEIDRSQALSFGLIAEDVAQVSPELITRDEEGKPQTVRYEAVNAMLLNEFLKEHKKNEAQGKTIAELKSTIAQQQRAIDQLAMQMQKMSAQIRAGDRCKSLICCSRFAGCHAVAERRRVILKRSASSVVLFFPLSLGA